MRVTASGFSSSPTDLANFLACRRKTQLDLCVAHAVLEKPLWVDPLAKVLQERGMAHEHAYIARLRESGLIVEDLSNEDLSGAADGEARAIDAMRRGVDVIVQAPLRGAGWFGYTDVLRRVETPSPAFGAWSYEVHDTKLSRETRGGTILQLCVYSEMLGLLQGRAPEMFEVISPVGAQRYRVAEFGPYYRLVARRYREEIARSEGTPVEPPAGAVSPTEHCDVCRWWDRCNRQRREADHLSFVAGLGRVHEAELVSREAPTLRAFTEIPLPIPFKPRRGARETYEKLREQARVQHEQRSSLLPVFEQLPISRTPPRGWLLLPEPSAGDVFLDLEGDPFAREGGREYLFGLLRTDGHYTARWAYDDAQERAAFEALIDDLMAAHDAHPDMHVYHYAPYEPAAMRRLAGRYATREAEVDILLRGRRFVDLYAIVRQTIRAGVESYSIKKLEPFYGFAREVALARAGDERRVVEIALETGDVTGITAAVRADVEGYNRDDCRSTVALRDWLEGLRAELVKGGEDLPRPSVATGESSESVAERDRTAEALRARLLERIGGAALLPADLPHEARAIWRLAYLIDWHRREERVAWGEYHRLRERPEDDLLDEPAALSGLQFVSRQPPKPGSRARTVVDTYVFPAQECEIAAGAELYQLNDDKLGEVVAIDKLAGTVTVKKTLAATDVHPRSVISRRIMTLTEHENAIQRLATRIAEEGFDDVTGHRLVNDLLLARPPRLRGADAADAPGRVAALRDRSPAELVLDLDESLLAIQGPPGAGKTYTGAHMIAALIGAGRNVGIVANSHKVITKLAEDALAACVETQGSAPAAARKPKQDEPIEGEHEGIAIITDNGKARAWLDERSSDGRGRLLGGTAWMWAREEFANAVDVLFVDEAGQMSLANVLAVSQAARNMVLLGDPQQLEQPQKGSHPDGVDVSALDHLLGGHQTMPAGQGIFLPVTWRLAPALAAFTSDAFYEGKLRAREGLERQRLDGTGTFDGAGLHVVEVTHDGCQNASDEEVEAVLGLVQGLTRPGATWTDAEGVTRPLTKRDILVVAPYNAQVSRLCERLGSEGPRVGTVDKFQGQEAPVVIYSMTTSRPEDAPRGMEFLYSPNRLNVATSRARCAVILVASPRLFEPACATPRQMQLASALCRFREVARSYAGLEALGLE